MCVLTKQLKVIYKFPQYLFCLILFVIIFPIEIQMYAESWEHKTNPCPLMYSRPFVGYAPKGNISAGNFTEMKKYQTVKKCTMSCCRKATCNIVFMHDTTCYHIQCASDELCIPIPRPEKQMGNHVTIVLVRPVTEGVSWADLIEMPDTLMMDRFIENDDIGNHYDLLNDRYANDDMMADDTGFTTLVNNNRICDIAIPSDCPENEKCIIQKARTGVCQCTTGFTRNASGSCVLENFSATTPKQNVTMKPTKKTLTVSAVSKEVRLPESEATLSAFTVPNPPPGQHYSYEWTLLKGPVNADSGTMSDQNGATLHLTHLAEGLYTFLVRVSSNDAYGETLANVSVLPPKRINQPPVVIITPASQIIRLPNTGAILDGSNSHDDDKIISWHWELQRGPLGYNPHLLETSTLQLKDLSVPGNYTFKLTVTDSDQASNSSSANITVLKVTDYPPVANAGQDIIIYLPHNSLTLNGNLSTDDHEITSWEWTKSPGDDEKAADMQDTRTPYLRLSHLEKGMYTFVLRVTDSAGQSASADVRVFVKPAAHRPPVANAGNNMTISLPQNWATLEGSGTSDSRILSYKWEQLNGPKEAVIEAPDKAITNVTHLTRGHYVLKLTLTDDVGNAASNIVTLNVTQVKNDRPKANAGGDQTIELPFSLVRLNGSLSTDDAGISSWQWTREDISLAAGRILGDSDKQPILLLGELEPGRYVFKLTVTDEQGLTADDTASLMVRPDALTPNVVELTLGARIETLTQAQVHGVMQELGLLLRDDAELSVRQIRAEHPGGRAVLAIVGYRQVPNSVESAKNIIINSIIDSSKIHKNNALPGRDLERLLRQKLKRDSGLLRLTVASLRTAVCQNNCSGHGVCDERSRRCLCEAFWMQNLFEKYLGGGEADCEWSVLYVVIGLCATGLLVACLVWGISFLCSRACPARQSHTTTQRPPKYSLLGDDESLTYNGPKSNVSESDTDSDVIFDPRTKNGRELLRNGHAKSSRNGFIKLGRRIKT